jgi:hypothetical protein
MGVGGPEASGSNAGYESRSNELGLHLVILSLEGEGARERKARSGM